jgi:hypothetical protein
VPDRSYFAQWIEEGENGLSIRVSSDGARTPVSLVMENDWVRIMKMHCTGSGFTNHGIMVERPRPGCICTGEQE